MSAFGTLFQLPESFFLEARPDGASSETRSSKEAQSSDAVAKGAVAGPSDSEEKPVRTSEEKQASTSAQKAAAACHTCSTRDGQPLTFGSYAEQREHFKSDWHRFNIRRKLAGRIPLDEEEFERFLGENDEVSSISGSESDSEDEEVGVSPSGRNISSQGARVVFTTSDGKQLALWRCVLGHNAKAGSSAQQLTESLRELGRDPGIWVVVLSRGGHFAAAVFECRPQPGKGHQANRGGTAPLVSVLAHKTFHRYVVRQGQGGRQSGKDATGKYAKSAGSQIRRHNEAALDREILEVFRSWGSHLAAASRIFLAAPGANGAVLFSGKDAPLQRSDPRICGVPFTTRRPTFAEAKRVLQTLLTVWEPAEVAAPLPKKVPKVQPAKPAQSAPEPAQEPEPATPPPPEPPLHQAARAGDSERIQALLEEGHDPAITNAGGKTAYAVAADKAVRDAFRRRMAAEPERWNWAAAGVPSALTADMEAQRAAREAEKKARLKEKEKERKRRATERKKRTEAGAAAAAESEISAAAAEAAAIAARSKDGKDACSKVQSRSEADLRRKREQMAAAAEARMAALQLASQQQQLW